MSIREVSGKIIWFCALLAGGVGECISSPFLAYSRDWWVQKEVSIKYSCLSYQYFWVNYATVKGAGGGGGIWHLFFLLHDSKKAPKAEHFFHWIYPTVSPSCLFLKRCFSAGPGCFPSLGEKAACTRLAGEQHPAPSAWALAPQGSWAPMAQHREHQDGEQTLQDRTLC